MQENTAYIRPKVVGPFPGPCASRSYVHPAALYSASGICAIHFTITYSFIISPSLLRHIYWRNAFPLYGRDYSSVLEAIEKMEKNLPGFFYAGKPNKCLILECHNILQYLVSQLSFIL
jgi:hypothetical protein